MSRVTPSRRPGLTERWRATIDGHVIDAAWSPDGQRLAVASVDGPITIFDGTTGTVQHELAGHNFGTAEVSWNADSTLLASAGQDGKVRVWDADSGDERAALDGGASWVEHVAWCPHAPLLATAAGRKLRIWNDAFELIQAYPDQPSTIGALAWDPQSGVVATAAYAVMRLWSPQQDTPVLELPWQGSVLVIAWSPNGKYIATGDQDATVHFWYVADAEDLQMSGYPTKVRELAWDPSSQYLATGGGPDVLIWNCGGKGPEGTRPRHLMGHDAYLSALAYQHRGPLLASGCQAGRLSLWPARRSKPLATTELGSEITRLRWSPDDTHLAATTSGGDVVVLVI